MKQYIKYLLIIVILCTLPKVYAEEEKNTFRVCAYNVGNFALGKSGKAKGNDDIYEALNAVFTSTNADIYMITEWDTYFNYDNEILSTDIFPFTGYNFSEKEGFTEEYDNYVNQVNIFKGTSISETVKYFRAEGVTATYNGEEIAFHRKRGIVDNVITIDGKEIHFIVTHLNLEYEVLRQNEIKWIFDYIKNNNIEYYVIAGDFNHGLGEGSVSKMDSTISDIDLIRENANPAQGNKMIKHNENINNINYYTYTDTENNKEYYLYFTSRKAENSFYDDIVISPNMYFNNIYTAGVAFNGNGDPVDNNGELITDGRTPGSDHLAIIADIGFKDNIITENDNYKVNDNTIYRIAPSTISDFTQSINTNVGLNIESNDEIIKTGDTLNIDFYDDTETKEYTLSVLGDTLGEGTVSINGIKKAAEHIVDGDILENEYLLAADYNNDSEIKMNDIMQFLTEINQQNIH